jgi:hypothetical protein
MKFINANEPHRKSGNHLSESQMVCASTAAVAAVAAAVAAVDLAW